MIQLLNGGEASNQLNDESMTYAGPYSHDRATIYGA